MFDNRFTNFMRALRDEGLDPHIGLGLANRNYDNRCTPFTEDGREAFARFANEVRRHYGDQIIAMGIYNEPNGASGDTCLPGGGPGPADCPTWTSSRCTPTARTAGRSDTFGLIHKRDYPEGSYTPKPAYVAYAVMTAHLAGLTYRTADQIADGVHSHVFTGGTEPTRVMWSATGTQIVRIQAPGPVTVTDIMGRSTTLDSGTLTLTGDPTYVDGDIHTITTTTAG